MMHPDHIAWEEMILIEKLRRVIRIFKKLSLIPFPANLRWLQI